jgi:hypothetical protein
MEIDSIHSSCYISNVQLITHSSTQLFYNKSAIHKYLSGQQ